MTILFESLAFWVVAGFISGSLPFSLWVTRGFAKKDVRDFGDQNPGATNAMKAGGLTVGLLAYFLDISKGAFPVAVVYRLLGWTAWQAVMVAMAVMIGSAFSPFLKFKGSKSLSVSLGIWIGLTLWEAPVVILVTLTMAFLIQNRSGWAVVAAIVATCFYLAVSRAPLPFFVLLGLQAIILFMKFRTDLRERPELRPWLDRRLR